MKLRLILIAIVVVGAIGGAAYYFGQQRKALQSEAYQSTDLIPGLADRINAVDHVRLESQEGGVVELARGDSGWAVTSHFGYPANQDRINSLLKQVATLETIEPKTRKPENHKRLNLNDPAEEDSLGTRITLKVDDDVAADLVVGLNQAPAHGGGAFVRHWGEDQTWLAKGEVKPKRRTLDLLERTVVNIDGRRMRSARIVHPEGDGEPETLISKAAPAEEAYALAAALPEGWIAKESHELATVARVPDFLVFEAVRPAAEVVMDRPVISVFETFDGLRLTFAAQEQPDGAIWTTITADAAPRTDGVDDFIAAEKGQDSEAGRIAEQLRTADEVAEEVARWSKAVGPWAYKLTEYKTKRLTSKALDLAEAPEIPAKPE